MILTVKTLNVLAPCYARPEWYPKSASSYLKTLSRRKRILSFLQSINETDIISLQEVTDEEFEYYLSTLESTHYSCFVPHERRYWSTYFTDATWVPNGNALFIRKYTFHHVIFTAISLGGAGNKAILARCIHKTISIDFRIVSLHVDADIGGNRKDELSSLNKILIPTLYTIDIVAGDFNDVISDDLHDFKDALQNVGSTKPTHPHNSGFNSTNYQVIDHIIYRYGLTILYADVLDYGLWSYFPEVRRVGIDINEENRLKTCLELLGTDHFPVIARFYISKCI
jgi:endonuclease/exonuclease/phosphatase family metal-dependent hydrolase